MKSLRTEIVINAPAEAVWNILSSFDTYPSWNPFVINISGDQVVGSKLTVLMRAPEKSPMAFKPRLLKWTENKEIRWLGHLGFPGIFDGEHYFLLEPADEGTTRFVHGENFRGLLVPFLWKSLKSSTFAGFEAMNSALKEFAESGVLPGSDVTK